MDGRLDFDRDGGDWPNRAASRLVADEGYLWHVQIAGEGPCLLLLHGTGASSHSWRGLLPLLARQFRVIAPDLPGHGFTRAPDGADLGLSGMSRALHGLLARIEATPVLALGHSAGAAIAGRMTLDGMIRPDRIISLNGALLPFRAVTSHVFSGLARLLAVNPVVPWMFAMHAGSGRTVERLLQETGSSIDARGVALYRRLAGNRHHVAAALKMMASWDLPTLERDLPALGTPLDLVVGTRDRTVPPDQAFAVRKLVPHAEIVRLPGLGHLAHEEKPALVADLVAERAGRHRALAEA